MKIEFFEALRDLFVLYSIFAYCVGLCFGNAFFRKDRLTIQEREKEEEKQKMLAEEAKRSAAERRKYTLKVCNQCNNTLKTLSAKFALPLKCSSYFS